MKFANIAGYGYYVPERVLTNAELETMVDTSDKWIVERTGIEERRIAAEDVFTSDVASMAAKCALKQSNLLATAIDLIIVATVTPDMYSPSVSCLVQKNIEAINAAAFDVNAACTGFIYSLNVAKQFIATETYKNIMVIGADCLSKITEYKDRNTCVLFGDGAGAVILSASDENKGVLSICVGANGNAGEVLTVPALRRDFHEIEKRPFGNYNTIWMNGQEVFKFAVKILANTVNEILKKTNLTLNDIDLIIPHQANIRIIEGAIKRMSCSCEKVFTNLNKYGNMSSASVPVALCQAIDSGKLKEGSTCIIVGFGAGLTWGGALLKL